MIKVKIGGKEASINPANSVGKGGEADIFDIGRGAVLKLFKDDSHPDVKGDSAEEDKAKRRIAEHQGKLKAFPSGLSNRIIVPNELAYDKSGKIVGYTMRFLKGAEVMLLYGERRYREGNGVDDNLITRVLLDLWETIENTHGKGVVIGDFNDLNVLIDGEQAYLIDSDSFQFGQYLCQTYTNKFVDPIICNPQAKRPEMVRPHNDLTDWYAYAVMVMQSLLFVGPYGGVYQAKKGPAIPLDTRPLKRITVFNPNVIYPKPARHFSLIPDEVLHFLEKTFAKDARGVFPKELLKNLRWQKCLNCGAMHARAKCPVCATQAPGIVKEVEVIRGKVKATRIFKTDGVVLFATVQNGNLSYLYHERDRYLRERGVEARKGRLVSGQQYAISKDKTYIGRLGELDTFELGKAADSISTDFNHDIRSFDANADSKFWVNGGNLYRDGKFGSEIIGQTLQNQTSVWAGTQFGFGFYRAGAIFQAFVFETKGRGINDSVKLPKISGQLIDAACSFSSDLCWFFLTVQAGAEKKNRAFVLDRLGRLSAEAEMPFNDGSWLGTIHGKVVLGNSILSATDEGIVRAEISGSAIQAVKSFPDTEPFVDSETTLLLAPGGVYAIKQREILRIEIS